MVPPGLLLLPAGVALLAGIDAALLLAALPAPLVREDLADRHGMLMALGFLGTLIALERAMALRRAWGYAAPGFIGAGAVWLAVGLPQPVGGVLLIDGLVALLAGYAVLFARQRDEATAVQALGATGALAAVILWFRVDVFTLLPWLVTFVLLTIAAERIELARLHRPRGSERLLLAFGVAVVLAAAATLLAPQFGHRLFGLTVLALTWWLAVGDVARKTIRIPGLPRYSAVALLLGYGWLAVAALTWLVGAVPTSVGAYDVVVHAVFLGFAMSMVMAHAPVILPAVLRRPLPYHRALWPPLVLLHAGLAVRFAVGDGLGIRVAWQAGAWLTVAALLLLPATAAVIVGVGSRRPAHGIGRPTSATAAAEEERAR